MTKKDHGRIIGDEACPKCKANGRDATGNHLIIFEDGFKYCNRCHYKEEALEWDENPNMKYTLEEVKKLPIKSLSARGISKAAAEFYGVHTELNEVGGDAVYYYPVFEINSKEPDAYKTRELPKTFGKVGESLKGKKIKLLGQEKYESTTTRKRLLICEGQDDMLAAWDMLKERYPQYTPNVVSLPNGGSANSVKDNFDFVNSFEEVILCLDQDNVGGECTKAIRGMLGMKAKMMKLPLKDANDMLLAKRQKEFISAFFDAKPHRPEGVVVGSDITIESLQKTPVKGYMTPYPKLNAMTEGLRKGELITITGASGQGKTTLCRELIYCLRKTHNLVVGNIFLEELLEKTVKGYIAIDNNIPLGKLRAKPDLLDQTQWLSSYNNLIKEKWVAYDHFGSMPLDQLMERLRHMVYGEKCDFIILDHISLLVGGQKNDSDVKALELAMTELATFCTESGVGIINVAHLSRNKNKKSFNEGGQVSLTDLKGSSALEQLSFTVIAYERNQQAEEDSNVGNIRILKCRETGVTGVADECIYNPETGRLLPVDQPLYEEPPEEEEFVY